MELFPAKIEDIGHLECEATSLKDLQYYCRVISALPPVISINPGISYYTIVVSVIDVYSGFTPCKQTLTKLTPHARNYMAQTGKPSATRVAGLSM